VRNARAAASCTTHPRTICPFCFSDKTEWIEPRQGTIYSYKRHAPAPVPYAMARHPAEGPRMVTTIVDCDFDS